MVPVPEKRIADFENMGFGMFVHFGLYSQLGMGEWTYRFHNRDMEEYKKLKDTFTVENFDADELVLTAKEAGCRYITFTTRHHDGFSLYDTRGLCDFDAPHSACGRDLVAEFTDACRRYGIVPFFYHTTLDWYQHDYEKNFDAYLEYLRSSVEVLCKNYGKIGGLWFDGNWDNPDADWKEDALYSTIRKYQPDAIIVNNTGIDARGKMGNPEIDSVTYERGRPSPMIRDGMAKYLAAEMCETLNDHWGIGNYDLNYKSPRQLIESLCSCRKVGANFLLNIGPDGEGRVDPYQRELMKLIGRWVSIYGESIYCGRPHPAICDREKDFVLRSDDSLYFFIHGLQVGEGQQIADEEVIFRGITGMFDSVEWMDNGEKLEFTLDGGTLFLNATAYPYGTSACVRVAKATIK